MVYPETATTAISARKNNAKDTFKPVVLVEKEDAAEPRSHKLDVPLLMPSIVVIILLKVIIVGINVNATISLTPSVPKANKESFLLSFSFTYL